MSIIKVDYGTIGGGITFSINEYNCYSASVTFQCTNAFFTIGDYGDNLSGVGCNYMGKVENGNLTNLFDRGFYSVSYSNGTLSIAYSNTTDQSHCYVKIMYE